MSTLAPALAPTRVPAPAATSATGPATPAPALRVLLRLGRVRGELLVEVAAPRSRPALRDEGRRRDRAAYAAALADLERHRTAAIAARRGAGGL
ncbi:hypothetical protein [Cellulomonas marina]|uniref:Uncharacterized protein n=1 Tax=Cellulomonas marina TaxID=988821 RepID=A0A1I0XZR2_9CELL|nr:hypothetical protein [Cellulomonas marina]GIG28448.1 hypothetical protein Cma02nite_10480 [Cellulomonas marina]SFB06117.1 hypothetical protein SAMN05421867_10670 [Cellulomonas marina]